jgi:hypothetical protein
MDNQNVFLGATGDVVATYDNSGVVQPGSSSAPADTSVTDTASTDSGISPDQASSDAPAKSSNPWLLYLGGALVFYYLILKKK